MTASLKERFNRVFAQLQDDGLLMASDSKLPNLTQIVTGEQIRGSWWSHKLAHTIFGVANMLEDHPDVMVMKLISGKVTFVHRELWDSIYSIGVAREDWQMKHLSAEAKQLLKALNAEGSINTHERRNDFGPRLSDTTRELESRLLIHAEQIHTESGRHSKMIETWDAWAKRVGFRAQTKDADSARRSLDQRLTVINEKHNGSGKLPWPSTLKTS